MRFPLLAALVVTVIVTVKSLKPSKNGVLAFRPKLSNVKEGAGMTSNVLNSMKSKELWMCKSEASPEETEASFNLGSWFDPNTRGGVIVWSTILITVPILLSNALVDSGMDADKVGAYVGFGFVCLSMVGWASTYLFRVANKDMTYATQLREYENAVLEKRLEELADDEIQALLEEIESDDKD